MFEVLKIPTWVTKLNVCENITRPLQKKNSACVHLKQVYLHAHTAFSTKYKFKNN